MGVLAPGAPAFNHAYARTGEESFYPSLWKGLVLNLSPQVGTIGSKIYDLTSWHHDGALNTTPQFVYGPLGRALHFTTASDYINIPDQAALEVNKQFTLGIWVMFDDFTPSGGFSMLMTKDLSGGGVSNNFELRVGNTGTLSIVGNGGAAINSTASILTTNKLYFLVATFDGTTSSLYINGEFNNSGTTPTYSATTRPVFIGHRDDGTGGLDGKVWQALIYNRYMTKNEVKYLYAHSFDMLLARPPLRALTLPTTTTVKTITSDAQIKVTQTKIILSDTDIKNTTIHTILSNSDIVNTSTQTITSDTLIKAIQTKTTLSNTDIAGTTIKTILSDSQIVVESQHTIFSNADIFKTTTQTILSNTDIKGTTTKIILSDTEITSHQIKTILSDSDVASTSTKTIISNSSVALVRTTQIVSQAIVLTPLDVNCEVLYTKDTTLDRFMQVEVIQVTPGVPFNIQLSNVGNGDSLKIEWDGTAPFYNVYRVDPGPTYVKLNSFLISDHFYIIGGLTEDVTYTFIVRGADGQG